MQKDFNFSANPMEFEDFQNILFKLNPSSNKKIDSDLPPFVFGDKIDSLTFHSYILKFINQNTFVNTQENGWVDQFDNEIKLVGENGLKAIAISLYVPQSLLPRFECLGEEKVYNLADSNTKKLDKMFYCLPKLKAYCDLNKERFLDTIDRLQAKALNRFLLIDWLGGKGYQNPDYLIKKKHVGNLDAFNRYTHNLSLAWIKGEVITLITLCTAHHGTFYASENDYMQNITDYQTGKAKYPILRCVITTLGEAQKTNFASIFQFLENRNPVQRN
jgi:hypothetical protein